ncbi:MAG: 1-acyl-sn-glycerol-3-phosphate acyltransferase [Bacteroidetes bacterium]|nr:1-acyl-sn-glycerol-3-phosphate acyltransferase [Bacteroidota bacterium]
MISILKLFIRAALWLFCAEINTKNKYLLNTDGALLIIANHPNSFLDAIIIGSRYNRRIHFLARGDVFTKKHHRFLLSLLNMIPVYRLREGKEFLHLNGYAFKESARLLKNKEAVLIFIEGTCLNTNQLQPFKKGTARILETCHAENIFPQIHLAGIAYNNFKGIGKRVNLCLSIFIQKSAIISAKDRVEFNQHVFNQLSNLIVLNTQGVVIKKTALYYLHLPLYTITYNFVQKKTKGTVFFDSVLFGVLFFLYPLYLLLIIFFLHFLSIPQPIIFATLGLVFLLRNQTLDTN